MMNKRYIVILFTLVNILFAEEFKIDPNFIVKDVLSNYEIKKATLIRENSKAVELSSPDLDPQKLITQLDDYLNTEIRIQKVDVKLEIVTREYINGIRKNVEMVSWAIPVKEKFLRFTIMFKEDGFVDNFINL